MKTQMNCMIALLLFMANATIAQAINYPTYNNTVHVVNYDANSLTPAYQAGDEVFQTRNLTPMVDGDGYAVEPYSTPAASGPSRARGDGGSGNVGSPDNPEGKPLPIGSILILLLFALMHVGYIAYSTSVRKQK